MQKKNINEKTNKMQKLKSAYALKSGALATGFTAAFIIVIIAINVLLSVFGARTSLTLDLTKDLRNTLTEENVNYIKTLEKDIKIYVIGSEDTFVSSVATYAENYRTKPTADDAGYYNQTLTLLKEYEKHSDKIEIEFLDVSTNRFEEIANNYNGYSYGDLFVESTFMYEGKEMTRRKLVTYDDIYLTEDKSGYAAYGYDYYYVVGSRLEMALASAIYTVSLEKTIKIGVPKEYCGNYDLFIESISAKLNNNNYELVTIEGLEITEFSNELDGIMLFNPKNDFSAETIDALEKFLKNDGNMGKSFYYFPSVTTVDKPNINEFLEEWGISYANENGVYYTVYNEEPEFIGYDSNTIEGISAGTVFTQGSDTLNKYFIVDSALAMEHTFNETNGLRTIFTAYKSSSLSVLKPSNADDDWEPSKDAKEGSRGLILIGRETDAYGKHQSYIVGFATSDVVTTEFMLSNASQIKNLDVVLEIFNETCEQEKAPFNFEYKSIASNSFIPDKNTAIGMKVFFIGIVTIAIIGSGIGIWAWRKNR